MGLSSLFPYRERGMKEVDLYSPVKRFLESQDYEVKGEIQDCDVVAVRPGETPVIVELKLSLNLEVVLQAVERLSLSPTVYVCIPNTSRLLTRRRRQIFKLFKMLGLGLLVANGNRADSFVSVLVDPGVYRPRQSTQRRGRLLGEFSRRVGDPACGGKDKRTGVMTAYRQRVLAIARFLQNEGPTRAAIVAAALAEPKAREMMYRDVYGWFDRTAVGVYDLSPRGKQEVPRWLP
ncbi:hypothetical protein DPPLL_23460 [Desulfofustis limnaeus]|jgi:hypothetical protein|uniref:Uncharacterized protein n=2 Tax=Desulfofustis limnaeus TaxID=2740163 RepID=A0ABN6M875_9BACT|nr:hypothetical protein DPPLL_23460 [Desulfofustis limnaeus]